MGKILKIEDAKIVTENGKKITRYVFNDDKIVRINTETDEIITKNVPRKYIDLISLYSANVEIEEKRAKKDAVKKELRDRIEEIRSGKGAGLGVFVGILLRFTIIGPIIASFCSFKFLNDISDEEYLKNTEVKDINFKKGFFATANCFGLIVMIACCAQWKADMISVLEGNPTKQSLNKHTCFKVWCCIAAVYDVFYFFMYLTRATSTPSTTKTTSNPYYYRSY